jgi:hypothetical protein
METMTVMMEEMTMVKEMVMMGEMTEAVKEERMMMETMTVMMEIMTMVNEEKEETILEETQRN